MDGSSGWETRILIPQWSNDPISPSIFDPLPEVLLPSSSSSMPHNNILTGPLSDPGIIGIDGPGSGSGSNSEDDDVISLIFSDSSNHRRPNNNPYGPGPGPAKRARRDSGSAGGVNISFRHEETGSEPDAEAIQQMKEMIYRAAAFRPVNFVAEEAAAEKPRRRNVRISSDPQTVAARHRRERISERLRVLQKLVPGGSKMDTASMLDEAANYLKFLREQVKALEAFSNPNNSAKCFVNHHNQLTNYCPFGGPENYLQFSSLPFNVPMHQGISSSKHVYT